mmetsp:Transcript_97581/g.279037  ORF Transcript_97581/g.279037 Transcript_97581/m.279037 type:complete len:419 (-) Transcript_97581:363-1619(-)
MGTRVAALAAATLAACGLPGASSFAPAERFITGFNVGAGGRPDAHCHPSHRPRHALPAHPSVFPRGFGYQCCSRLVLGSTVDPSNDEDDDAIDSEVVPDWDVDFDVADGDMEDGASRISNDDRSDDGTRDPEFDLELQSSKGGDAAKAQRNPFMQLATRLSSTDIIGRFMTDSPPRVQQAMRTTVVGLMGNMDKFAIDAATVTTAENLANLMFQLQMTGYMFRNAEYRLSLSESLKGSGILPGDLANEDVVDVAERVKDKTKVKGQVKVTLKDGTTLEVDADAYVAELRGEVDKLRGQLARIKETREEAAKTDLVAYINSLPRDEMQELTTGITPEVLDAMEGLVKGMLKTVSASDAAVGEEGAAQVTLDSQAAMQKLCMWQLVTGFNLRELEVKEAMRKQLEGESAADIDDIEAESE